MTVSVSLASCTPHAKDLERKLDTVDVQGDGVKKEDTLKSDQSRCGSSIHGVDDMCLPSSLKSIETIKKEFGETDGALDKSSPSSENGVVGNQGDISSAGNKCLSPNKASKGGKAVSRGRRKSDNKDYNQKSQGNSRNRRRKISKSTRDYENSSSNGGNSGADGNGEDNGSDDDDEDDDGDEDDDDDDDDDDDEVEDEDEDEDNEDDDDDDDISLNGNDKSIKTEKIKQEPDDQEMCPTGLQSFMAGLDGSNIPLADLLEKLPNSVYPGDESGSTSLSPGVPVTLHGIVCHEIGGVLVVNIKWRNKFYCGSLIDCSKHAWASPRFPPADGSENEVKMGGKGGKGKRRQKNISESSATGVVKEATPLKHKLRGRKKGAANGPPPKSQVFKGIGKRRAKNMDDDEDGPRPGKRSCTIKTTVSPQPSPTLIECPEPGCDKKYKHINGLRYHQAHAHLEESNQSDERSASTSPSPVEEFKEPDTKPGFKGRTSRVSARARSISPSLAAAIASMNEKKSDSLLRGNKKRETPEPSLDGKSAKEAKISKSPIPASEEESNIEEPGTTIVEISDKCQQACEHEIRKENSELGIDQGKQGIPDSKSGFKPIEKLETGAKCVQVENVTPEGATGSAVVHASFGEPASSAAKSVEMPTAGKVGIKETAQNSQEVWETVIDSGFSVANGSGKSQDLVEDVEKAIRNNSLSNKQFEGQLCIPDMQPVDLRQAVDTGVGLINQLGIEVEDISENEEDIDPGQDSEYTSEDLATDKVKSEKERENSFPDSGHCQTQIKKPEIKSRESFSNSDSLRTKLGSSFYFDMRNDNTDRDGKTNVKQETKSLSECQSRKTEAWSKSTNSLSQSSVMLQGNTGTRLIAVENKTPKTTSGGISTEDLVSKSISRSAIEPPLTNTDAPSVRYQVFECRNYGDDFYDKCIRTSNVDKKGSTESRTTLAPIRYPELLRNGATSSSELASDCSKLPSESIRTTGNANNSLNLEENTSISKIPNNELRVAATISRTHSPTPEAFNRNLNLPDKLRTKSPSSATLFTGTVKNLSSSTRSGFASKSPSSFSTSSTKLHSSIVDRKEPSNPFQPVIVEHDFHPTEGTKGIKQEVNLNQSKTKTTFVDSKSRPGYNDPTGNRKSPDPGQETENHEKSYKAAARALSRSHPALISRNSYSLPPSLPVGVALPYPRASDGGLASSLSKGFEQKATVCGSSVTSVSHSIASPRPLQSAHDDPADLPQAETKTKQMNTLQVPIPVGEVSPVLLKRSPGPAIHSGLPPVLPTTGPGIKTQGSASSHPIIRPGIKTSGMSDQMRSERKSDSSMRTPSPYGRSKSPVSRSLAVPKTPPDRKSPQPVTSYQKARGSEDSAREDSDVIIVKEDLVKDKSRLEKERERRDARDSAAEQSFRSQEPMSAEQLRNLQLQQQLTLQQQYYQPFMQGGSMPLEMVKNLGQLAYLQGIADPKTALLMQLMLEQEKQRSSGSSSHLESRHFEKKDVPKSSDRAQDDRRINESGTKKTSQAHVDVSDVEFRRLAGQSDSSRYTSKNLSPKVMSKLSADEPAEKRFRDDASDKKGELEEFLQQQKLQQQMLMLKQLQKEQMGASFPPKRQTTTEKPDRLAINRESEGIENGVRSTREIAAHLKPPEAVSATVKGAHHSFEAENSSGRGSPRSQVVKSQSLSASRSPRPSRSPIPASRYKDSFSASDEKTQFPAYLSAQLGMSNFDPSAAGSLPYGAHQMLVGSQFSGLPPGLVMSMPMTSHGESSLVTSTAPASREREERSPYRGMERDRSSSTPTSRSSPHSRLPTTESHERLQRLIEAGKESRHSPVMFQEERVRSRNVTSEQNVSPKSSRASDLKGEDSSARAHSSIISNNLAVSRLTAGHIDALTEEEFIRQQRLAAEYSDPRMGYYMSPTLMRTLDPAYAASMMQSSSPHVVQRMEHYMTKRP